MDIFASNMQKSGMPATQRQMDPVAVTHICTTLQMREGALPDSPYGRLLANSYSPYLGWALHLNLRLTTFPGKAWGRRTSRRIAMIGCSAGAVWRCICAWDVSRSVSSGGHRGNIRIIAADQSPECSGWTCAGRGDAAGEGRVNGAKLERRRLLSHLLDFVSTLSAASTQPRWRLWCSRA